MYKMLGFVLVAVVVIGLIMRGRLERLADLRFRWIWVLFISLVLGLLPLYLSMDPALNRACVAAANIGVLAFLALNLKTHAGAVRAGLFILLLGWLLNGLAIVANAGMPLSRWAYARSGEHSAITVHKGGFFKIVIAGPHTKFKPLGDVIPVRIIKEVLSIGDLLLIAGIAVIVIGAMLTPAGTQTKAVDAVS